MSDELKPCPFCGGEADVGKMMSGLTKGDVYRVSCTWCQYSFHSRTHRDDVAKAWNTRA